MIGNNPYLNTCLSKYPYNYLCWSHKEKPEGWPTISQAIKLASKEHGILARGYVYTISYGDRKFKLHCSHDIWLSELH
jgi:hypothetical protein